MINFSKDPDSSEKSLYETSAFTRELISEVARSHFSMHAWRILLSRSWARSLDDIRESPARARSCWSWIAGVAATGIGIISLTLLFQSPDRTLTALMYWIPWYASAVVFLLTHLGMLDDAQGRPHSNLLLPNGMSFLRLSLAPLVVWPCLQIPVNPAIGPVFAIFIVGLSSTDLLDGWLARRQQLCTRLGRMLDTLADLALLTFLALGLYQVGAIPATLLLLLFVRYPVSFLGVLVIYFVKGPAPLLDRRLEKRQMEEDTRQIADSNSGLSSLNRKCVQIGSGRKPFDLPVIFVQRTVKKSIVQAIRTTLPEFKCPWHHPIATPERRQRYFPVGKLAFHFVELRFK